MKSIGWLGLAVAALLAGEVRAQLVTVQPVALALTISFEGEEVVRERQFGNTISRLVRRDIVAERYSNREFLLDMVDEGLISSIIGWSLVRLTDTNGNDLGFFITKTGRDPIDVNDRLAIVDRTTPIEALSLASLQRGNQFQESRNTISRALVDLTVSSDFGQITARGVRTDVVFERSDANNNVTKILSGGSVNSLTGEFVPTDTNDDDGLVEGFAQLGRGRVTSL